MLVGHELFAAQSASEAKSGLNACFLREPGFAWLYLLRGFASYQLAVRAGDLIEKLPSQAGVLRAEAEFQCDAAAPITAGPVNCWIEKPNDELRYALHVNRGLLGLERRDFENAAADLEAAIRLNDARLEAYAALALVYQKQDKLDDAIEQYSRAIALRPDSAALYRGRADVDLARKRPDSGPAGAGPGRPGPGDPTRETGQPGAGARPHQSGPAAGPRSSRR